MLFVFLHVLFTKKIPEKNKLSAVYMWNMKPNELSSLPMQNINRNKRYFKPTIIGPDDIARLIERLEYPLLKKLWHKIPWWIVRADLARLLYIYENGGFYFDADCLVKKNFLPLVEDRMVLFIEKKLSSVNKLGDREKKTKDRLLRIANYAFGAGTKKHPFLKLAIDECLSRVDLYLTDFSDQISETDVVWLCGPDVITSVYHDFKHLFPRLMLLEKNNLNHQSFGGWRKK